MLTTVSKELLEMQLMRFRIEPKVPKIESITEQKKPKPKLKIQRIVLLTRPQMPKTQSITNITKLREKLDKS